MNSLRRQLTRWLLGTLAVLVGAALAAIYVVVWDELVDAFDATLQAKAAAVSALVEQREGRIRADFTDDFLRGYRGDKPRHYFEIWSAEGEPLVRSPSLRDADLPRRGGERPGNAKFWNFTLPNGRPGRAIGYAFVPVAADPGRPGRDGPRALLVVGSDRDELDETLGGLLAAVAGGGGVLMAAVWFVVPWVLRRGLRPLEQLGEEVARIDSGSLDAALPVAGLPEELRPIGDRLNALLARLAASFERERRFSADLAHELRTPLAELRSLAECALKWPEARDAATDQEVLGIATQMEALVTRMLALARGERGQLAAEIAPVALAPLVAETWRPLAARATARGLRVTLAVPPGVVPADATLLRSILSNLFDNAAAYAPEGSEVRVTGEEVGGRYRLRVANPAGELTPDDLDRLFDRFWRKEAARSGGGEHVGLGLSLARALASAMGWRLGAAIEEGGWLVLTLEQGE